MNKALFFVGLILFLILVSFISLQFGAVSLPFSSLVNFLLGGMAEEGDSAHLIFQLRLTRLTWAILVGGGLSVAGVLFQGLFRNPLVEPYTLGVSGGAALAVSLGVVIGGSFLWRWTLLFSLAGAWGAVLLAYSLARRRRRLQVTYLLLVGVMISFISSSLIMLLMSVSNLSQFRTIIFWAMGSLAGVDSTLLPIAAPLIILGVILAGTRSWTLNALALGEEGAAHLGIKLETERNRLFFLGSLLAGTAVAVAGVIGFVGLVVPHFVRRLIGSDHRFVIPASFLAGSAFLVLCDTLARTLIAPVELPVGVITGILGGSAFIYFLSKKNK